MHRRRRLRGQAERRRRQPGLFHLPGRQYLDHGYGIAVDAAGHAYVTGETFSSNFPITPGAYQPSGGIDHGLYDAFVAKLSVDGASLIYSTYLGGGDWDDSGNGIAVDSASNAYVTGRTYSADFPTTPGAYQTSFGGGITGSTDAFVAKFLLNNVAPLPPTDSDATPNSVVEGAANGTAVGVTASSTDADGDLVSYTLTDSAGDRFAIDISSGVVTVAHGDLIDYESASGHSYHITVQASDGELTSSQTFTIVVTSVAPAAPIDSDVAANSVVEGAANGTPVGITASSSDPAGGAVTYTLTDNAGDRFAIGISSGVVTVVRGDLIDYESADGHSYHITVEASDGELTSSQTFAIAVTQADVSISGEGASIVGHELVPLADVLVATFHLSGGSPPPGDFTAMIDWGDGQTSSGTVSAAGDAYQVTGSHTYAGSGSFTVKTTVVDGGLSAIVNGSAAISARTPHERYVAAVYLDVLGRSVDPDGLAYWAGRLDAGTAISSVAESIVDSDEYYANFVIKPAFLKLLERAADADGVRYWTTQMRGGLTDQHLQAKLVSSDEFYDNAGGTDMAWVDAVYSLLLGRAADAAGETYWSGQLSDGQTRSQVAERIAGSQENNTQLINDDYFHYLGRAADPDGLAYWLEQFAAGKTNEDVIAGFTGSDEYYQEHTA